LTDFPPSGGAAKCLKLRPMPGAAGFWRYGILDFECWTLVLDGCSKCRVPGRWMGLLKGWKKGIGFEGFCYIWP